MRLLPILLATAVAPLFAQDTGPTPLPEKGYRVFHVGNSHTDSIMPELPALVWAAGDRAYESDTHTIPGAPLRILIEHRAEEPLRRLREEHWDFLILQSYNSTTETEIQAALDFTEAAREGNPDVTVLMYSIWPPVSEWDTPSLGRREEWNEGVVARIREAFPGQKAFVVPSSLAIRRVGNAADAGGIPGMQDVRGLFKDMGHMGTRGAYVIACTMISMMYQTPPMDFPAYGLEGPEDTEKEFELAQDTAHAMRLVVMDTLADYAHDGMEPEIWISSGRLEPALVGNAYQTALTAVPSDQPKQWNVAESALPPGLRFSDGRLSGTPTRAGVYHIPVTVRSGGEQAERLVTLNVAEDKPLSIPEQDWNLSPAFDEYMMIPLKAAGTVGRPTWSVAEGNLPQGLQLADSGLLKGTPGQPGAHTFTLAVTDKHPAGPRTAQRSFTMNVQAIPDDALKAWPVPWEVDRRQPFESHDLSELSYEDSIFDAEGNEIARVAFGWKRDPRYDPSEETRQAAAEQFIIAVQVLEPSVDGIPLEAVHIYFDSSHNRELIYNEDDAHYMMKRGYNADNHRAFEIQGYRGNRTVRGFTRTQDDGTWQMLLGMGHKVLRGTGVHTKPDPFITYGFDVAVGSIDDPEKRFYLRGDSRNDTDTSAFGSLIILEQ